MTESKPPKIKGIKWHELLDAGTPAARWFGTATKKLEDLIAHDPVGIKEAGLSNLRGSGSVWFQADCPHDLIGPVLDRARALKEERDAREIARDNTRRAETVGRLGVAYIASCKEARSKVQACLDEWGQFTFKRKRALELLDIPYLYQNERDELLDIVRETERRAAERTGQPVPEIEVALSDEFVEQSLQLLTGRDTDQASLENGEGWSSADSAIGHWCHAMLKRNREVAIAHGRHLIRKYLDTQLVELRHRNERATCDFHDLPRSS